MAGRAAVFPQRVFQGDIAAYFSHIVLYGSAHDGAELVGLCDFACTYLAFGELIPFSMRKAWYGLRICLYLWLYSTIVWGVPDV